MKKMIWFVGMLCMALFVSSVNSSAVEISRQEESKDFMDSLEIGSLETKYYFSFNDTFEDAVPVMKQIINTGDSTSTKLVEASSKSVKFTEGKVGKALYLDGTYGLRLPVEELGSSYTIAFWVKTLKEMTDFMPILQAGMNLADSTLKEESKWMNITKASWLGYNMSPVIWTRDNTYYENVQDNVYWPWYPIPEGEVQNRIIPANGWQHIIITVDGTEKVNGYNENVYSSKSNTYINGELYGTGVVVDDIFDSNVTAYLGINCWDDLFIGYIDELQFYDVFITGEQAKEIFAYEGNGTDEEDEEDETSGELTKSDLKVSPAKKTINVGKSFSIRIAAVDESEWADFSEEEWLEICEENIDSITFRSTKSSVASVNKTTGKVKGKRKGSAIIKTIINFADGESGTYKTKVYVKR